MKIALYSDTYSNFRHENVINDSVLHVFPEFFLKDASRAEIEQFRSGFPRTACVTYSYSKSEINYIEVSKGDLLVSRPKAVGFGDEKIVRQGFSKDWYYTINEKTVLPLLCYEIYFPHFPVFSGEIDMLSWSGAIQHGQISWFKELIKIRSMDFGCPIFGTAYPRKTRSGIFHPMSFVVYPINSKRFDLWFKDKVVGIEIKSDLLYGQERSSHAFKASELFKRKSFGPFKNDIDEDMFDIS